MPEAQATGDGGDLGAAGVGFQEDLAGEGETVEGDVPLRADPEVALLAKRVIIMGGAFGYEGRSGNITPAAEANIHGDPVAADEIFAAEWPVVVVGLDVM